MELKRVDMGGLYGVARERRAWRMVRWDVECFSHLCVGYSSSLSQCF